MLISFAVVVISAIALPAAQLLLAKYSLSEKAINRAIIRRFKTAPVAAEMRNLREVNSVMRNLLTDLVENEEFGSKRLGGELLPQDQRRFITMREARRREIYAEAKVLLRQTHPTSDAVKATRAAE